MTDDQHYVWEHHPSATCLYNQDTGKYKVYCRSGDCCVALSASWDTRGMAWAEAASNVRSKIEQVTTARPTSDEESAVA